MLLRFNYSRHPHMGQVPGSHAPPSPPCKAHENPSDLGVIGVCAPGALGDTDPTSRSFDRVEKKEQCLSWTDCHTPVRKGTGPWGPQGKAQRPDSARQCCWSPPPVRPGQYTDVRKEFKSDLPNTRFVNLGSKK